MCKDNKFDWILKKLDVILNMIIFWKIKIMIKMLCIIIYCYYVLWGVGFLNLIVFNRSVYEVDKFRFLFLRNWRDVGVAECGLELGLSF